MNTSNTPNAIHVAEYNMVMFSVLLCFSKIQGLFMSHLKRSDPRVLRTCGSSNLEAIYRLAIGLSQSLADLLLSLSLSLSKVLRIL